MMTLNAYACYWKIFHSGQDLLQLQRRKCIFEPWDWDAAAITFICCSGARLAFCINNNSIC